LAGVPRDAKAFEPTWRKFLTNVSCDVSPRRNSEVLVANTSGIDVLERNVVSVLVVKNSAVGVPLTSITRSGVVEWLMVSAVNCPVFGVVPPIGPGAVGSNADAHPEPVTLSTPAELACTHCVPPLVRLPAVMVPVSVRFLPVSPSVRSPVVAAEMIAAVFA
jgi:hypothetical protein